LVVPAINYQKSQLIPSPSVILPSSLSTVFETGVPVYKSLNSQGPQYIQQYLQPHSISGHHPRSCDQGLLKILRTNF
ncbi:unnamed protein product, partial [Pocillopora meandrina]